MKSQTADLMGVRQAAKRLGVHENTLRRWHERGLIRAVRLPTGVRRFRRSDILALRRQILTGNAPVTTEPEEVDFWTDVPVHELITRAGARPVTDASDMVLPGGTEEEWSALYKALSLDR